MTLPSSGQLTLQQIATEFGGSAPYSLNQYYRGGGLVPNTGTNAAVPTSGAISFSNFYGASAGGGPNVWTAATITNSTVLNKIRYLNNSLFVAGGGLFTTSAPVIFTSPDGITFTARSSPVGLGTDFRGMAFNGTSYYIGGTTSSSVGYLASSSTGATWATVTTSGSQISNVQDLLFANGKFQVTGASTTNPVVENSTNGINWTTGTGSFAGSSTGGRDMLYDPLTGTYIILQQTGSTFSLWSSTNGTSWTQQFTFPQTVLCMTLGLTAGTIFVAGGNSYLASASTSALGSWTTHASGFNATASILGLAVGNSKLVAVGSVGGGSVNNSYSSDGNTWTAGGSMLGGGTANHLAFGNGRFVAVGSAGGVAYTS